MGDVEMARMLMLFSPSVWNALAAMPGLDFMPVPTMLTFAMSSSTTYSRALTSGRMRSTVSQARFSSAPGQVKLMSVMPSSDTFWMIMSTLT